MSKKNKTPPTNNTNPPTPKEFLQKASASQQAGLAQIAAAAEKQKQAMQSMQAKPFDFSKVHLHIGIPAYGGLITEPCFTSFLRFVLLAQKVGLTWSLDTMVNESLITRARNNLMAKMMYNKAATHFMFIDADIRFQAESIFQMLAYDRDIIGGLYPKKAYPISYAINLKRETKVLGEIFTVDTLATGFLIFKRKVYEDLIAAHPETKYVDDVGLGKQYEPYMYSIFDCYIDKAGHYLSEDWAFCRRAQELGYDMWAHSKVLLNHIGHHEFHGDLSKLPDLAIAKPSEVEQKLEEPKPE
ncbi:MAG: hypothetical protein N2235_03110 [Fischerella sp.]|nr:hypothetical protein [Fischerella sp.]